MTRLLWLLAGLTLAIAASGQTTSGELRLVISDKAGLPVAADVRVSSEVNQYQQTFTAGTDGRVTAKRLPFGLYRVSVNRENFAAVSLLIDVRSVIPQERKVTLDVASVSESVTVTEAETLIDPFRSGSINRIGSDTLKDREAALPGRALATLVNTQPGWLLEANGVLHPRGSEYQTQYVVDGIPLTDNRSAAFVPDFDVDDVQSMSIMTAGYPAEFGRKLGGVIEVVTARDTRPGFHGKAVGYGGSFETAGGFADGQYGWDRNTLTLSANGSSTNHYLDPPVLENFTNHGATSNAMAHFERDLSDHDRIGIVFRREQAKFLVPDEIVQQLAGQRQDRNSFETSGQVSYSHIFSANVLADMRGMARSVAADFWSNPLATPMIAGQNRSLTESYLKGALSVHHGTHEFKFGAEADFGSIREALHYSITDSTQFDPSTALAFRYSGAAQDREQAFFAQDQIRFHNLTLTGGVRFDHYGLVVHEQAWSPRAGLAYYVPSADLVLRFSYDRIFQTPAFENLLVSSSPQVELLSTNVVRLPVRPSRGNYYEAGVAKGLFAKLRIDANLYHRDFTNFADDDLLLNTGVGFPIAFARAEIYGEEVKVEVPRWGNLSGFVSYSNMRGNAHFPIVGGLFIGPDAPGIVARTGGAFPITQDQRNTVQSRFRYQMTKRVWGALSGSYGSGLPVSFNGTYQDAIAQYSRRIVDRVNFSAGRVRPSASVDASIGATLRQHEKQTIRLQADILNVANRLNVIDFAGLFSGTAIAAPRSAMVRITVEF